MALPFPTTSGAPTESKPHAAPSRHTEGRPENCSSGRRPGGTTLRRPRVAGAGRMSTDNLAHALHRLRHLAGSQGRDLSDGELLERFRAGREEAAFALLVQRHGPMVLGVCR